MQKLIKNKYTKSSIFLFITIVHITLISLYILPYYINGDQQHYRELYSGLKGLSLADGFDFYKFTVSSEEPVYFFLSWLFSNLGIEKDIFITIANIILGIVGYKTLLKLGSKPSIAYIIICSNFYFLVFYFAAERLKFSLIFFSLFFISNRFKFIYAFLSILSHSQIIIFYISVLSPKLKVILYNILIKFKLKRNYIWMTFILMIGLPIILIVLGNHLTSKFNAYYTADSNIIDLLRMLAFFALSFLYSSKKIDTIYAFLPLLILVLVIGGERVNFIGYFVFLYFSIHYRKGFNLGVILVNIYFAIMGFIFIDEIMKNGSGF